MKLSDISKEVTVDGHTTVVSLGDTVWWFAEAQLSSVPSIAFIKRFNDGNQVELAYVPSQGNRLISMAGVRLAGDPLLRTNGSVRAHGCWCPRGVWPSLNIETPKTGT